MELNKIEELLVQYFEGDLLEEEELELKTYFLQENVPLHLLKYKSLFNFFEKAQQEQSTRGFEQNDFQKSRNHRRFLLSIAASVLVLIGTGIFIYTNYYSLTKDSMGTYDDPEVALKETQKALSLLSKHVNTGYESVHYIEEYESTRDKIFNLN